MPDDNKEHMIFQYKDVFYSCFYDNDSMCTHRCQTYALNYVHSGEMMLDDGETQVHVQQGECVFVPRDVRVTMHKQPLGDQRYQGIFIAFPREFLRSMYESAGIRRVDRSTPRLSPGAIKLPRTTELASLFASMLPYFDSATPPSDDIMRLKQQEALLALLHIDPRFAPTLFDFSDPWKIDILDFLNANYMRELSTEDMALYTGRSLAAFKRDFKRVADTTPERWLTRKRLQEAYVMIQEGRHKMVDVCYQVGFKNPSHFTTAFKRQYGVTPQQCIVHNA